MPLIGSRTTNATNATNANANATNATNANARNASSAGVPGTVNAEHAEAAFSTWLSTGARNLDEGARLFAIAARDSTFTQAKVALAQVAMFLDQNRAVLGDGVKDSFFVAVQPFLVDKARAEGNTKGVDEIQRGVLTFDVQVPDAVFEAANVAAGKRVEELMRTLDGDVKTASASMLAARSGAPVEKVRAVSGALPPVSDAQWGAFLGRVISNVITPEESALLQAMADKGRVDVPLNTALSMSGVLDNAVAQGPSGARTGAERIAHISAAMALARRAEYDKGSLDVVDKKFLALLSKSDASPSPSFSPPMTIKDGDLEGVLLRWIGVTVPRLKTAAVMNHPHIPRPDQLKGTQAIARGVAQESGKFLADYNVLTVMHQLGSAPPWLALLEEHLGLDKKNYLGVAVPYSVSEVAFDRLNREGWKTVDDHDPRDRETAKLQDLFGAGNPNTFDELKEADVKRAVDEMIKKSDANGKPIMVVDDGGYVIKVVRKYFPEHEHRFKIVEWTMRGIRQLETVKDPKAPVVAAAETMPKTKIEPAFIADSTVLHFLAAVGPRLGDIKGKKILVIGAGNIGNAVALALKERGAFVSVYDKDPKKLDDLPEGLIAVRDVKNGVTSKDAILAATGANSLPPDVFNEIDPGTLITSASSVDIETRDPDQWKNGHWEHGLVRATIKGTVDENGQLQTELEKREILGGGFVLNLSRRARIMPIQREELILMNVTEAMAVAHHTTSTGKVKVETRREDRIEQVFAREYPAEYERAMQMLG